MIDPYIEKNSVLKNKLGIKDYEELNQAEADIGFVKLIDVDSVDLTKFDANLFKNIHKHIFEDIFEWAGEYRTVPIYKEEVVIPGLSLNYEEPKKIEKSLDEKIADINEIAWKEKSAHEISMIFARKLAMIWKVHPFRDGNTRTTLSFGYLYAQEHGFPFDMKKLLSNLTRKYDEQGEITQYSLRDKFVLAALDEQDYPEPEHLAKLFEDSIIEKRNEKEKDLEK